MMINVKKVKNDRNYWLVRTKAGSLYNTFSDKSFISIGWDKITTVDGKEDNVVDYIREIYPEEKQPRYAYNQIKKFISELDANDVVLIPSVNSEFINIGIISSNVQISESKNITEGSLNKKRTVNWIKEVKRRELDPSMFYLFNSHHIISNANEYSDAIDRTLNSFYVKGDSGHLVIKVTKEKDITTYQMNMLMNQMLKLVEVVNIIENKSYDPQTLKQKSNVQSPGFIEFIADKSMILSMGIAIKYIQSGTLVEYAKLKLTKKDIPEISEQSIMDFQEAFLESMHSADGEIPNELKNHK